MTNTTEEKRKHIEETFEEYIDVLLNNPGTSASAGYNVESAQREANELAAEVERLRALIAGLHCVTSCYPIAKDCLDMRANHKPEWKWCQVCRTKWEATHDADR